GHRLPEERAGAAELHAPEGVVGDDAARVRHLPGRRGHLALLHRRRRGDAVPAGDPHRRPVRNGALAARRPARARVARIGAAAEGGIATYAVAGVSAEAETALKGHSGVL